MATTKYFPFLTYDNTNTEIKNCVYITYTPKSNISTTFYPYITYKKNHMDTKNKYVLRVFDSTTGKTIECELYDNIDNFPIPTSYLTIICADRRRRFCPLNFVNREYDSGLRVTDNYNNEFQVCTNTQENIINNYFPYGNLLIPLDNIDSVYQIMSAIFGTARVKKGKEIIKVYDDNNKLIDMEQEYITFIPPTSLSAVSKIFAIGLNITFTNKNNITYSTLDNGLLTTSGNERRLFSKAMMLNIHEQEAIKITFNNSILRTRTTLRYLVKYPETAPVKNVLIIGSTIENLPEESSNFNSLLTCPYWYMYENNAIIAVDKTNNKFNYFYNNYLNFPNSKHLYNYYDMAVK